MSRITCSSLKSTPTIFPYSISLRENSESLLSHLVCDPKQGSAMLRVSSISLEGKAPIGAMVSSEE